MLNCVSSVQHTIVQPTVVHKIDKTRYQLQDCLLWPNLTVTLESEIVGIPDNPNKIHDFVKWQIAFMHNIPCSCRVVAKWHLYE